MVVKANIHSIHFDADRKLLEFIQERLNKLTVFYDRIIEGEVFLRVENTADMANKLVEIRLKIPGSDLFAKKTCKSFEESTDEAIEALRRQLKKHKGKLMGV